MGGYLFLLMVLMVNYSFLKTTIMKFVKLGIFTLALGMFIASCGSNEEAATEEPATEETTEMAPAAEEAPAAEPVMADSTAPAAEAAPATEEAAH